jgi:hypothetical protein
MPGGEAGVRQRRGGAPAPAGRDPLDRPPLPREVGRVGAPQEDEAEYLLRVHVQRLVCVHVQCASVVRRAARLRAALT